MHIWREMAQSGLDAYGVVIADGACGSRSIMAQQRARLSKCSVCAERIQRCCGALWHREVRMQGVERQRHAMRKHLGRREKLAEQHECMYRHARKLADGLCVDDRAWR